jgi:hypothetical protein
MLPLNCKSTTSSLAPSIFEVVKIDKYKIEEGTPFKTQIFHIFINFIDIFQTKVSVVILKQKSSHDCVHALFCLCVTLDKFDDELDLTK